MVFCILISKNEIIVVDDIVLLLCYYIMVLYCAVIMLFFSILADKTHLHTVYINFDCRNKVVQNMLH